MVDLLGAYWRSRDRGVHDGRNNARPPKPISTAKRTKSLSVDELDARLIGFEQRLDQRLSRIEALLLLIAEANGHCLPLNGGQNPDTADKLR